MADVALRFKTYFYFIVFLVPLLVVSGCKFESGNGEPYTGIHDLDRTDPDDPNASPGKTYELKAFSSSLKVLVSYHDKGMHELSVLQKDEQNQGYRLLANELTQKKRVASKRVYESSKIKLSVDGYSAELHLQSDAIGLANRNHCGHFIFGFHLEHVQNHVRQKKIIMNKKAFSYFSGEGFLFIKKLFLIKMQHQGQK